MWLGLQVGADAEMTPRQALTTVPYAYRIGTVDEAAGGDINGNVNILGQLNVGWGNSNEGPGAFVAGSQSDATGDHAAATLCLSLWPHCI